MPRLSRGSLDRLSTCDPMLQILMKEAIRFEDFSVLCGRRGELAQNKAYEQGFSKVMFPDSAHNKTPSIAVDIAPYPLDWNNIFSFYKLAACVLGVASELGIKVKWGGHFKDWFDGAHYELRLE